MFLLLYFCRVGRVQFRPGYDHYSCC